MHSNLSLTLIKSMQHGDNIHDLIGQFYKHIDQPKFHSVEEEEAFTQHLDGIFRNLDQLIYFIFPDEKLEEGNLQKLRNRLLHTLTKDFVTRLVEKSYLDLVDPAESNLRGLNEHTSKFQQTLTSILPKS